jgi:hypothetical protein
VGGFLIWGEFFPCLMFFDKMCAIAVVKLRDMILGGLHHML